MQRELSSAERALIAIGAASATRCKWWVETNVRRALEVGVSTDQMNEALAVARKVEEEWMQTVLEGVTPDS